MSALAGVTHTYATAAGPLLRMLSNLTVTSRTIVDKERQLTAFLTDVTAAGNATRDLLARNEHDLVAINRVNRPVLSLLARYSPEFPCFVRGYKKLIPRIHDAVPHQKGLNHAAHVVVEFVPAFPTYQYPIDLPEFNDNRGPNCYGLPNPPKSLPVIRYKDGTEDDPRFDAQGGSPGHSSSGGNGAGDDGLDTLLGTMLGTSSRSVPDIADLLWGPIARGSAVNLS
jgi:ABC-type transporter Mla subunit MlaD